MANQTHLRDDPPLSCLEGADLVVKDWELYGGRGLTVKYTLDPHAETPKKVAFDKEGYQELPDSKSR
ncbi:hypothetical protein VULLAG_LOCUS13507 [Vulpes lagopus]